MVFLDFSKALFGKKLQRRDRDFRASEGLVIGHARKISGSKEVEGTSLFRTMLFQSLLPMPQPAPPPANALLLKAADAAAQCSVSVRTWYAWDVAGKIPRPIRMGRTPLWPYEELRAWVTAGCPDRLTWQAARDE